MRRKKLQKIQITKKLRYLKYLLVKNIVTRIRITITLFTIQLFMCIYICKIFLLTIIREVKQIDDFVGISAGCLLKGEYKKSLLASSFMYTRRQKYYH